MRFLLDVNVLVALSFPESESHQIAQRWFSAQPDRLWATCSLTQAGLLRAAWVLLGRTHGALPTALASLEQSCSVPNHEFWPDSVDLRDLSANHRARLIGRNQVADMQLLPLAHKRRSQLVTFDAGVRILAAGSKFSESLLVL